MAVLSSLRRTPGALARNPIVFVPVFVLLLTQVPTMLLQATFPILASLVSLLVSLLFIVVVPFFQGGLIAMSDEALDGTTSLDRFVAAGKANYTSLLVAYLLLLVANFVLGVVGFLAAIVAGVAVFAGAGGPSLAAVGVLGAGLLLFLLAYLAVVFFIQFYGQAVVLDGHGAIDGLKHSVGVVRGNLLSSLGYSLLVGLLGLVAGGVFGVASLLTTPEATAGTALAQPSPGVLAGVGVVVLVVGTLFGGFFGVYSVAFYRELTDRGAL
ncbi:hypothetical protein [Halorarius halobius]|uniref:DUF7847 domain-containing protein n=1 Tax=Halorarius halobius TaxID=2962671 RepID=UPI0020CFD3CB|nr:hypothetical protein [Halorarius halobius]